MKTILLLSLLILLNGCGGEQTNRVYPYTGITLIRVDQHQPDSEHNGIFYINNKTNRSVGSNLREMTARGSINGDFAEVIVVYDTRSQESPKSVIWNRGGSQGSPQYSAQCNSIGPKLCNFTVVNPIRSQFIFNYQELTNTSPSNDARIYGEIYLLGREI